MRRRTTAEMDELVRTAGFEKVTMEVDEWGIFTVSVARRSRRVICVDADSLARKGPRRIRRPLGPFSDRLRLVQLDHLATPRRRHALLRMGTLHSVRAADDRALHVDRSLLCRGAVSLPQRAGTGDPFQAHRRCDRRRRNLLSPLSASLRLRAPARERLARRGLRLVSSDGSAATTCSLRSTSLSERFWPNTIARHTRGLLRSASNVWFVLVGLSTRSHLPASLHGRRRRFRSRRLLHLFHSRVRAASSRDRKPARRSLLCRWRR